MCGRCTLTADLKKVADRFGAPNERPGKTEGGSEKGDGREEGIDVYAARYKIAPTQAVIVVGDDGKRERKSESGERKASGEEPEYDRDRCRKQQRRLVRLGSTSLRVTDRESDIGQFFEDCACLRGLAAMARLRLRSSSRSLSFSEKESAARCWRIARLLSKTLRIQSVILFS
jgi:hypothetical protein